MPPFPLSHVDEPRAVTTAIFTAFVTFARSTAANNPDLARHALLNARAEGARLGYDGLSKNDQRAIKGAFDLLQAAIAPDTAKQ
jgi:hypothetical protein